MKYDKISKLYLFATKLFKEEWNNAGELKTR